MARRPSETDVYPCFAESVDTLCNPQKEGPSGVSTVACLDRSEKVRKTGMSIQRSFERLDGRDINP
jgi:hypothetical protein